MGKYCIAQISVLYCIYTHLHSIWNALGSDWMKGLYNQFTA